MPEKISIVIPVYNVEKYIEKCINSIKNQTHTNFEVIVVDDGSQDESINIAKKVVGEDSRFKFYTKENGGLSSARNYGIKKVTSDYITFIDSDDFITEDYLEYLYSLIEKYNVKLSICSLYNYIEKSGKILALGNGEEGSLTAPEAIEKMCYHDMVDTCSYAKIYHKSLFDNIEFPEGKLFEDIGTTYKLFLEAGNIAYGFKEKYYYVLRENSIVTSGYNEKKLDLLEMTDNLKKDLLPQFESLSKAINRRMLYARFSTLNQMFDIPSEYVKTRKEIIKYIKLNSKEVFFDRKAPIRDKVAILVLNVFGFEIYKYIWKMYLSYKK